MTSFVQIVWSIQHCDTFNSNQIACRERIFQTSPVRVLDQWFEGESVELHSLFQRLSLYFGFHTHTHTRTSDRGISSIGIMCVRRRWNGCFVVLSSSLIIANLVEQIFELMSSSEQSSDLQTVNQSNIQSNNIENSDSGAGVSISEVSSLGFNMPQSSGSTIS